MKTFLTRDQVVELLRSRDINLTQPRIDIAHVLFSRMEHLSADQILSLVNESSPSASKATVYNTLKVLREAGLIREVIVDPTRVFFDPNTEPHHHLFDVVSGCLTDIPDHSLRIEGMPVLPEGMVADGIDIIVRVRPAGAQETLVA
ncbi:Fur family transcriptional regulator [Methyloversatilis thermotolerans]|uniref:Fur family transcriptional regulator n=1 Tax=Methyloversatilis thermotolerans TaxID=1346290 RepID=UPI00036CC53B|nr:Fur family transcriptional regulator [Methyloversatilis thermotolerans]